MVENTKMPIQKINVALVGCGVVGSSLITQLHQKHQRLIEEFSIDIRIKTILVRTHKTKRKVPHESILYSTNNQPSLFSSVLTTDITDICDFANNDIDIVVEVAGGIEDAYRIISECLKAKKPVVTANKALLAQHGSELYSLASKNDVDLLFEAAVAGGIPFIRSMRESLAVEKIDNVKAILNGTTNFILSQMTASNADYQSALLKAQEFGFAESDPTFDVEGIDSAAKLVIVSLLATGTKATIDDVYIKGITQVTSHDIQAAKELGYVIKLIALLKRCKGDDIILRVQPTFVPNNHPFSTVHDGYNAVFLQGEELGDVMFYGQGAGGAPTASAVLGDLLDASINVTYNRKGGIVGYEFESIVEDNSTWESCFYLCATVKDEPGVLAQLANILAKYGISVEIVRQSSRGLNATVNFITHKCIVGSLDDAVNDIQGLSCVNGKVSIYPLLD